MHDYNVCFYLKIEFLQIKLLHPASLLVQLPEGLMDYLIKVEGRKDSYKANGKTNQKQSWVEPITWSPSSRQDELDDLRLEQGRAENRRRKKASPSHE